MDEQQETQQMQARLHGDIRHALANNQGLGRMEMEFTGDEWRAILAALEIAAEL